MNPAEVPGDRPAGRAAERARLVLTRRVFDDLVEDLRQSFEVLDNQSDESWSEAELRDRMFGAEAVLVDPGRRLDEALLSACPRLRVVSNIAVGFDNLDLEACTRLGIVATNTPDVLTEATADHAWALLLAAARRVVESDRYTRAGQWQRFAYDAFLGASVHGATLGVLGLGRIGRAVAQRASGFQMPVLYHNRRAPAGREQAGQPCWVPFEELLRRSDFLVLTLPYDASTRHCIGAAQLAQMKPGAILVNIARGGVVDDAALVEALRAGRLGGAALDVMENEPKLHPGLIDLERVVLTPHIGSATLASRRAMVSLAIENLRQSLRGERPAALLNPGVWERRRRAAGA